LLHSTHATQRQILREKGTPAAELGLHDPSATTDQTLDAMVANPSPRGPTDQCHAAGREALPPIAGDLLDRQPDSVTRKIGKVVVANGSD